MRTILQTILLTAVSLLLGWLPALAAEPIYWPVAYSQAGNNLEMLGHIFANPQQYAAITIKSSAVQPNWRRTQGIPGLFEEGSVEVVSLLQMRTPAGSQTFVARIRQSCSRVFGIVRCDLDTMRNQNEFNILRQLQRWWGQHPLGTADFAPEITRFWHNG